MPDLSDAALDTILRGPYTDAWKHIPHLVREIRRLRQQPWRQEARP